MKRFKKIICVLLMLVLAAIPASADWMTLTTGSGQVMVSSITAPAIASAASVTGVSAFYGIIIKTDGTNDVTVNIYDNTSAAGTKLIPTDIVVSGSQKVWTLSYSPAIKCVNGIYVSISVANGGSVSYQVMYDK
jgi:hypothetical protein